MLEDAGGDRWGGRSESEAKRYYRAGGGPPDAFQSRWQQRLDEVREVARQLNSNQLHTASGGLQYVIAGRRPPR